MSGAGSIPTYDADLFTEEENAPRTEGVNCVVAHHL